MVEQSPAASSAATMMRYDANKKSLAVSYLLWFFVGMLGGHRFYHGRTGTAVVQLVLFIVGVATYIFLIGIPILAAVGIWALVDAFFIPGWVRSYNNQLASSLGG
jgi:TM2 domain-containing membrane protein YozV